MKLPLLFGLAIVIATLSTACRKSESAPDGPTDAPKAAAANVPAGLKTGELFAATCDTISSDSECGEVVATSDADKAKVISALNQLCHGKVNTDKICQPDKMIGTCRVMKDVINHYYSDGPKAFTLATAKAKCEKDMGHWVP